MKKVILSGFFALCAFGMFAQPDTKNLPATAKDFIQQNFSSNTVQEVEENSKWQIWADDKYEVKLSNGIELDFDENGNIIEIDSQKDAIPMSALPSAIATYLKENYPDSQVIGWEKEKKSQEVELLDGTELEFDGQGNFRKID
ncbi:PepSY-like domain-containing protein [Salegentibacter mishustinae]|uniref:PepSY-like domain-containing protein n=1 Tax=Salegentibacter mishustinae TaxID=270918 RepID=UPI001CE0B7A6|nr:PepSY-like domain-containing protein [Salegentibacter mishustinae]UBZ07303.1 PepSY-like domain-containing protein [Salegentibacter mishustinae]